MTFELTISHADAEQDILSGVESFEAGASLLYVEFADDGSEVYDGYEIHGADTERERQ